MTTPNEPTNWTLATCPGCDDPTCFDCRDWDSWAPDSSEGEDSDLLKALKQAQESQSRRDRQRRWGRRIKFGRGSHVSTGSRVEIPGHGSRRCGSDRRLVRWPAWSPKTLAATPQAGAPSA